MKPEQAIADFYRPELHDESKFSIVAIPMSIISPDPCNQNYASIQCALQQWERYFTFQPGTLRAEKPIATADGVTFPFTYTPSDVSSLPVITE